MSKKGSAITLTEHSFQMYSEKGKSQQSLAGKKNGSTSSSKGSERFNADGTGRGLAGRDAPSLGGGVPTYRGGDVKDLSQILRR
ncbi:hypothetical protein BCR33DRAFT_796483 [Rhizoclosmatium globosum]|uniref:Uncharacterized protein n=1 Tax=Rhizoclosmatium globosum TaxID=329046 RepID=A0A1Y2AMM8_9FUNG|nr:hypothetical protein BCR33DRAFT_796483 [Rhizoclosmatium globosum]|eukprot:ORY23477.1 hypothetical protein BCR33DRAFT_796483 [Rhizoclosmatium globosum]